MNHHVTRYRQRHTGPRIHPHVIVVCFIVLPIVVFFSMYFAALDWKKEHNPQSEDEGRLPPQQLFLWTADELAELYDENEIRADQMCNGMRFRLTGTVDDIGKDIMGTPYITLETSLPVIVQCMFDRGEIDRLTRLSKGDKVTMVCVGSGHVLITVLVRKCRLL